MPRAERDQITGLSLTSTDAVLSLDSGDDSPESDVLNSATVYVSVDNSGGTGPAAGIIRVVLQAEVLGQRQTIASAFVVPGFHGAVINVSGINVDGWHVVMQSTNPLLVCKAAIAAKHCCAGFEVFVPPELLQIPLDQGAVELQLLALFNPAPTPFGREQGQYFVSSDNSGAAGTFTFLPGSRMTHMLVRAGGMDASVDLNSPQGLTQTVEIDGGDDIDIFPNGNLPIESVDYTAVDQIIVEVVR